ncbi:hypothetical protein [Lactobacillus plantarum] [Lactiplantibacillus mudanjiangensis]|uniref:DUF5677 domain-containing protein n=1 Tax=Lactiplantibacillus mudanjiangensis TaxID=1296538 RepID=UPI00101567DB|nr:hypothetical protein [Lactobacillus plantarum] [Lactiplantibacillus mudanjiangensis]
MTIESIIHQLETIQKEILKLAFGDHRPMDLHHNAMMMLLDGMIEKFKSIEVLYMNHQLDGVEILERAILEESVSLEYILMDSHKMARQRGRAFFLGYKVQSGQKTKNIIDQDPSEIDGDNLLASVNEELTRKNLPYKTLNEYIEYFKNKYKECFQLSGKSSREVNQQIKNWFNQDGTLRSIYDLFCKVNREDEYRLFYAIQSMDVHPTGVIEHSSVDNGEFVIEYSSMSSMVEGNCVLWILKSEQKLAKYFGIQQRSSIQLQIKVLQSNWKNEMKRRRD